MNSLPQVPLKRDFSVFPDYFKKTFKDIDLIWPNEESGCEIYKAKHNIDENLYAIKKIKIPKRFGTDCQKSLGHYLREVKILTQFNHPNIVKYHQCWIEEEDEEEEEEKMKNYEKEGDQSQGFSLASEEKTIYLLYIQMEYCTGGSLAAYLRQKEVTPQKAKQIFIQILQGMKQVHSQNIIHRDLKPENIFVDEKGEKVKIGDFGLSLLHDLEADSGSDRSKVQSKQQIQSKFSKESNSSDLQLSSRSQPKFSNNSDLQLSEQTQSIYFQFDHRIVGTPLYCSPEQLTGRKYGKETDIFALGLIFYQILGFPKALDLERSQLFAALRAELNLTKEFESKFPLEADIVKSMAYFYPSKRATIEEVLSKLNGVHGNGSENNVSNVPPNANLIKEDEKEETEVGTWVGKGQAHIYVGLEGKTERIKIENGITSSVMAGGNQNKGRKIRFSFQNRDQKGIPINPRFLKFET